MVEVTRQKNETTGNAVRRFTRRMQRSGFLRRAKSRRFRSEVPSAAQKKKEALRRIDWQKQQERLRKLGKIN